MIAHSDNSRQILAVHPGLVTRASNRIAAFCDDGYSGPDLADPAAVTDGVAVIPVQGVLVHDDCCFCGWGLTTYAYIRDKLDAAMADPLVRAVALVFNSPGGDVAGCFDLADHIRTLRDQKPIHAFVDESCYSAAYALASSCSRIVLPRTGGVGSIGVILEHASYGRMLDQAGIDVTVVTSGAHKADESPYAPLADAVKESLQAECDQLRQMFAGLVAAGRGLTVEAVLATEAKTYRGADAVALGLADAVAAIDPAFDSFIQLLQEDGKMKVLAKTGRSGRARAEGSDDPQQNAKKAHRAKGRCEEDEDDSPACEDGEDDPEAEDGEEDPEAVEGEDDPEAEEGGEEDPEAEEGEDDPEAEGDDDEQPGGASARRMERRRIRQITGAKEAKGRESLARHLAFNTGYGVQKSLGILRAAPVGRKRGNLSAVMPRNAAVGANESRSETQGTAAQAVLNSMKQAGYR